MGMFGDLKKLSTQQEPKQPRATVAPSRRTEAPSKKPAKAPVAPLERSGQSPMPSPSFSGENATAQPFGQPNTADTQEQTAGQLGSDRDLSSSQQPVNQSVDRPTDRTTNQSTSQLTNRSTHLPGNRIVGRPKAFYITERLDARLDAAVQYLQEKHGIRKVDRSTLVNALLDNDANWTEESLDLLVGRVLSLLTSRLTS